MINYFAWVRLSVAVLMNSECDTYKHISYSTLISTYLHTQTHLNHLSSHSHCCIVTALVYTAQYLNMEIEWWNHSWSLYRQSQSKLINLGLLYIHTVGILCSLGRMLITSEVMWCNMNPI